MLNHELKARNVEVCCLKCCQMVSLTVCPAWYSVSQGLSCQVYIWFIKIHRKVQQLLLSVSQPQAGEYFWKQQAEIFHLKQPLILVICAVVLELEICLITFLSQSQPLVKFAFNESRISMMRVLTTSVSAADFPHFKFQTYSIYSFSIMLILPTVFQDWVKDSRN